MKQTNQMAEDMFEKAREAFFGTTETSPQSSASSGEFLKPRDEPSGAIPAEKAQADSKMDQ
jgi:hypothetical protein